MVTAPAYHPVGFNGTTFREPQGSSDADGPPAWHEFSLNDFVRFRPNSRGVEIWRESCREALAVDADGWAKEPFWKVMAIFGRYMNLEYLPPIEMNIEIRRTS